MAHKYCGQSHSAGSLLFCIAQANVRRAGKGLGFGVDSTPKDVWKVNNYILKGPGHLASMILDPGSHLITPVFPSPNIRTKP